MSEYQRGYLAGLADAVVAIKAAVEETPGQTPEQRRHLAEVCLGIGLRLGVLIFDNEKEPDA
jgi:hypothetical protein